MLQLCEITAHDSRFDIFMTKWYYVAFRAMLVAELFLAVYAGKTVPFLTQFF
eukprot:CAMPEP_0202458502 /NCGR_PEP_ID=MMETSP1360-20130828/26185_1 /ASSEMBLY_ACC=CAM_ASM_000848 /TAXON_ID=515479 /ORGANISM="Licmophora paradoxa, Strain CCMP2313" /LENGTH=51 /DNA_ID=CAMNT_0049079081 /DNA_START=76 /DNA_END=228 /DNA_ORIENTATION=-